MVKDKHLNAISKFSKETIIKSMCFACLDDERVLRGCIDFEIDSIQKKIVQVDKKIKKLTVDREKTKDQLDRLQITIEINQKHDEVNNLYDEIFKLQNQY